jgi:hypothetical protein
MMRGVSWALAIWIATKSELNAKTMNEMVAATKPSREEWTVATSRCHSHVQPSQLSTALTRARARRRRHRLGSGPPTGSSAGSFEGNICGSIPCRLPALQDVGFRPLKS